MAAGIFQVDGQFYSSGPYTDWAYGGVGTGVFADDGSAIVTPSLRARDGHWGGHESDLDAFSGSGNKNNDDISANGDPWKWGKGSGPSKNDLTDVYASSAVVGGDIWLFLGAATRTTNGASHVDFEISQAGFVMNGEGSGTIVGLGPDAGRTAGVDFIVSVDYEDGGTVPTVSFRTWQAGSNGFEFVQATPPSGGDVFICTNDQTVPAPPWGTVAPDGSESMEIAPFQFVEIGLNLTNLGIDPSIFCTNLSTLMFKTRSSPSFTAALKDLTVHQFSLVPPPPATITPDRATYCRGDVATLCAPAELATGAYGFQWEGPGGPYPDAACLTTDVPGTYRLVVYDLASGCYGESSFELVMNAPPTPAITFDSDAVCVGGTALFCAPEAPGGTAYRYEWSGPSGRMSDARCIEVSEAGVYRLTIVDLQTGCTSATVEQTLTVNPLPVAAIAGAGTICAGTSTELCGPDGDYDYAWEGPEGPLPNQRCVTASSAGTYTLAVTSLATGCVSAAVTHDLTVVPVPVAEIVGPASFCPGTQAELCGPEGELVYTWTGPKGALPSTRCITVDVPGTYTLAIENPNGCASSTEHELVLDEAVAVAEMESLTLCTGEATEFCAVATGTGPFTYEWRRNGTVIPGATEACLSIPAITAEDAGEYTVAVQGRCGPAVTRQATLTLADVAVSGVRDAYLCEGMYFELCPEVSGLGPFTYRWQDETHSFLVGTQPCFTIGSVDQRHEGRYSLTVQGACGDPVVVEFRLRVGRCDQFCSKSKGFWGNSGGTWNGQRTPDVLDAIITPDNPIVLGWPGARSVTIGEGAELCVIEFLPADGPATPLPADLGNAVIDGTTCGASLGLTTGNGRLANGLLAATLVTELNARLDPRLPDMRICDEMITVPALPGPDGVLGTADDLPDALNPRFYSMPPAVLETLEMLRFEDTVGGLLKLAHLGLAGALGSYLPVRLDEIEAALAAIVVITHDCALVIECEYPSHPSDPTDKEFAANARGTLKTGAGQLGASPDDPAGSSLAMPTEGYLASPNPVRRSTTVRFGMPEAARTRIVVYDVAGRIVTNLVDGIVAAGHHTAGLGVGRETGMSTGVYFLRMEAQGVDSGTRFRQTRKIIVIR